MKSEENPKLLKTLNPIINLTEEVKKIDGKLEVLRVKFIDVKTNKPDMDKLRREIDELLDKRLEWMRIQNEVKEIKKKMVRLIRKKK